jgi:hypothetical protein
MALTISAQHPVDRVEEILTPNALNSEDYTDFLTTPAYELVG